MTTTERRYLATMLLLIFVSQIPPAHGAIAWTAKAAVLVIVNCLHWTAQRAITRSGQ